MLRSNLKKKKNHTLPSNKWAPSYPTNFHYSESNCKLRKTLYIYSEKFVCSYFVQCEKNIWSTPLLGAMNYKPETILEFSSHSILGYMYFNDIDVLNNSQT